jgi:predicted transcriptional regulator
MEISKTELEVMQVIWKSFPVTADIVIENLNQTHIWHEKTVKTLLNRLIKKQALSYEKKGRQYAYYPLLEKNDYQIKETHSFVRRLFQGQISPLVASFAKHESLSKDDIEELKKLIKSWDEKND